MTHEFVSGTQGRDLLQEVLDLLPADQTGKKYGDAVSPTSLAQAQVVTGERAWIFASYDRDTDTIDKADENFVGR